MAPIAPSLTRFPSIALGTVLSLSLSVACFSAIKEASPQQFDLRLILLVLVAVCSGLYISCVDTPPAGFLTSLIFSTGLASIPSPSEETALLAALAMCFGVLSAKSPVKGISLQIIALLVTIPVLRISQTIALAVIYGFSWILREYVHSIGEALRVPTRLLKDKSRYLVYFFLIYLSLGVCLAFLLKMAFHWSNGDAFACSLESCSSLSLFLYYSLSILAMSPIPEVTPTNLPARALVTAGSMIGLLLLLAFLNFILRPRSD